MGSFKDLTGRTYGRLTVIKHAGFDRWGSSMWECKCICGNTLIVRGSSLTGKRNNSRSCGCYHKDAVTKHGMYETRVYRIWSAMKSRCNSPQNINYPNYGGRGIKVCDEWYDFNQFMKWAYSSGYKDFLTLDRINVNGNYSPSNCRWADAKTQANNRRNNNKIKVGGIEMTFTQLAREKGMHPSTLYSRIRKGMSIAEAIETPIDQKQSERSKKRR